MFCSIQPCRDLKFDTVSGLSNNNSDSNNNNNRNDSNNNLIIFLFLLPLLSPLLSLPLLLSCCNVG